MLRNRSVGVGTYGSSYTAPESSSSPHNQLSTEKRFSFTSRLEFLAAVRVRPGPGLQSRPSTATSHNLVGSSSSTTEPRKQVSVKNKQGSPRRNQAKINTKALREIISFGVSSPLTCDINTPKPLSSPSPSSSLRQKMSSIEPVVVKTRKSRGYGNFIRKLFLCTKEKTSETQNTVAKIEFQSQNFTLGTGSELRDLRFYLGNESFRICRRLCRIQHDDEKNLHLLSPRVGSLNFNVRQFNTEDAPHTLLLPRTVFENEADELEQSMMNVFMENFISMLPIGTDKISRKANPSGLVFRLLPSPIIQPAARYLGAAFWLWLCAIDDQIEELDQRDFEEAIGEIKRVFTSQEPLDPKSSVARTSFALKDVVQQTELKASSGYPSESGNQDTWRRSFLDAIMEILYAFEGERPLLHQFKKGEAHVKLTDWMVLRIVTISARPFMVLARASLGLQPTLSQAGNTAKDTNPDAPNRRSRSDSAQTFTPYLEWEEEVSRLEVLAQCAMGLENDILGWEKDHTEQNILNSVEILFQLHQHRQSAMREMVLIHNHIVNQLCLQADALLSKYSVDSSTAPVSPARTLFEGKGPRSPFPISPVGMFTSPIDSSIDMEHTITLLGRIKSKVIRPDHNREPLLAIQVQYIMVLLGFVKGMAIWTSKAKRYAV